MITTPVFDKNAQAWLDPKYRRVINQGGTSSSKTYSILQLLVLIAQYSDSPLIISVVSESLPHLKKGAIRDFFDILGEDDNKANPNWNMSSHVYTFPESGTKFEFFGAGKASGPRRDILFINEANNVPWLIARALDIRTKRFTFIDYNPVSEFWIHNYESGGEMVPGWIQQPGNAFIKSTYLDALAVLPRHTIDKIESQRHDVNWWNVFGEGNMGKIEGLVYPVFWQCDELPDGGFTIFGLDWGYTIDPTTLTKNVIKGMDLFSKQLIYEKGMSNADIAHRMVELGVRKHHDLIWADGAEPKSIDEIASYGFNIKAAPKGPGSVEYGHQRVRQFRHYWTSDSVECIKEQRNFRYIEDRQTGRFTDKTTHQWSHGMDTVRYAVAGYLTPIPEDAIVIYDTLDGADNMDLH